MIILFLHNLLSFKTYWFCKFKITESATIEIYILFFLTYVPVTGGKRIPSNIWFRNRSNAYDANWSANQHNVLLHSRNPSTSKASLLPIRYQGEADRWMPKCSNRTAPHVGNSSGEQVVTPKTWDPKKILWNRISRCSKWNPNARLGRKIHWTPLSNTKFFGKISNIPRNTLCRWWKIEI